MTALATDTRPFAPFEWMLALRYLRARRKEGFISVIAGFSFLGILLGVATLIIVMAVMNGFRKELFDKILGLNGHVIVNKIGGDDFDDYDEVAKRLAAVPGVKQAVPLIEGQVMASTPAQALGGLVRGMREEGLKALPLVAGNIRFGTLDGFDGQEGIAIGTRLAKLAARQRRRHGHAGLAARRRRRPSARRRASSPTGGGVFEMGMSEYDHTMIFMPLAEAQRFFDKGDAVDVIEVIVERPGERRRARARP